MAETTVQANNKAVAFQGKPTRERPADVAADAVARAKQMYAKGGISKAQYDSVCAKAGAIVK